MSVKIYTWLPNQELRKEIIFMGEAADVRLFINAKRIIRRC